jgi:hypothetical protein
MNLSNELNKETALSQEQQKELNIPIPIMIEQGRTIHLAPVQGTGRLGELPSNLFDIPRLYLAKIARLDPNKEGRSSQTQAAIMQARRQLSDIANVNRYLLSNAEERVLSAIEQSGGKKIKRNTRRKRRKMKRQNRKKNKSMKKYTKNRK